MTTFFSRTLPLLPFTLTVCFLSCFPFTSSLSTVAISETSNGTLVCALTQSSRLNCASFPPGTPTPFPSRATNSLSGIVAGNGFLCALRSASSTSVLGCWRFSSTNISYKRIYRGPILKDLHAGNKHICGLEHESNRLRCWQWREFNSTIIPPNFSRIAVGDDFVCGLSELRNIKCFPEANSGISSVIGHEPIGNYSVIAAGSRHACAISLNGSLSCWGEMGKKDDDQFTSMALGENRSCALRQNGTVTCWGENGFGLPESLTRTHFITIEARRRVFCGIAVSNYSLFCWGNEILHSNQSVFDNVLPGPCVSACPCSRPLPNYSIFCSNGLMICEPCGPKFSCESPPPVPPTPPAPPAPPARCGGGWRKERLAFLVVGCVGSLSLVLVCCFWFFRFCKVRGLRIHDSGPLEVDRTSPQQALPVLEKRLSQLVSFGNGTHLEEFSLQVLHQVTENFSERHKVGTGSFGSVYRATLADGREVAIKRAELQSSSLMAIKRHEDQKDTAFLNELEFLSRLNHKNLVKLLGYCEDNNERILVYEYVDNGTLHGHLHKKKNNCETITSSPLMMSWTTRIRVALDAARGIEYLHVYAVPPIIHRDIKSSNILLDAKWTAKVSDFGLSLMGPEDDETHLSLHAAGTFGYVDPEYYRLQQLTAKSDVYSFGIVLLEMLSGYRAIHQNENGVPRNIVDFVLPYIIQDEIHRVLDRNVPPPTPFEIEGVAHMGYLAADCVLLQGRDRPTMTQIVNRLESALRACLAHPPPSLSRSTTESST